MQALIERPFETAFQSCGYFHKGIENVAATFNGPFAEMLDCCDVVTHCQPSRQSEARVWSVAGHTVSDAGDDKLLDVERLGLDRLGNNCGTEAYSVISFVALPGTVGLDGLGPEPNGKQDQQLDLELVRLYFVVASMLQPLFWSFCPR